MPEHKVTRILNTRTLESEMQLTKKDIKNLPKTAFASKVVNLFTRALAPFYRETKGLFTSQKYSQILGIFLV
jgi:hypothetical protein